MVALRSGWGCVLLVAATAGVAAGQDPCGAGRRLALFAGGDISLTAGPCVDGEAHANGTAVSVPINQPEACAGFQGSVTMGEALAPPRLRVDPDAFPGYTYYFIEFVPVESGGPYCRILARDGVTQLQTALGDSLEDVIRLTGGRPELRFQDVEHVLYFDPEHGLLRPDPGDAGSVVNFAPEGAPLVDLLFQSSIGRSLTTTFVNVRFVGAADADRASPDGWDGGWVLLKSHVGFRPVSGLAFAASVVQQSQAATEVGDAEFPALCLVTHDLDDIQGQIRFRGSVVVLGNVVSPAGPRFVYDPGFFERLPASVLAGFDGTCWDRSEVGVRGASWGSLKRRGDE